MKNIRILTLTILLSFNVIQPISKTDIAAIAAVITGGYFLADGIYTYRNFGEISEEYNERGNAIEGLQQTINDVCETLKGIKSIEARNKAIDERIQEFKELVQGIDIHQQRRNELENVLRFKYFNHRFMITFGAVLAGLGVYKLVKR